VKMAGQETVAHPTLAVAGFARGRASNITIEESPAGDSRRARTPNRPDTISTGIAARQFQRTFVGDGMEVWVPIDEWVAVHRDLART